MRQPMPPPSFDELLPRIVRELSARKLAEISLTADSSEPYRHWDELRFRSSPDGLTLEQWWVATKLKRAGGLRTLPLHDRNGRRFSYSLPDEVLRENDFAASHLGGKIALSEQVTNPATRDQYLVSSLIEEAVTSSQLEGASTSKKVAKELIRSGREPRDRSERMIRNNFYAMERVSELRDEPLSVEIICELHRIVTDGTLDNPDAAGRFQFPSDERVRVFDEHGNMIFEPPPADETDKRMAELCDFANATVATGYLPPTLRALAIHFMMGFIHPFEDGNGRTAHVLFYWSMLNQGYWLTEFLSVSRSLKIAPAKYARSFLYTETDDGDLTYFFVYHLGILHRSVDALNAYLERKVAETRQMREVLAAKSSAYNGRQIALIQNAVKNPDATYSVQSHMISHRIAMETARKDLVELETAGLLRKARVGKRFVFEAVPDIMRELHGAEVRRPRRTGQR